MHASSPFPSDARSLAARQDGVISRAQLVGFGLRDAQVARFVRSSVLARLDRGVYLLGASEPTFESWAWAGVLLGGPGSRLLGRSAAALEGLVTARLPIEVGVPPSRELTSRSWLRFRRERQTSRSAARTGAPPRTLIEDTVLDVCAEASPEELVWVITQASARLTTYRRLALALERRARIGNRGLIEEIVGEVKEGVRSPLEWRWVRDVERPHGLPQPTRPFRLPSGIWPDGAYEEYKVLLELDGRAHHEGERRFRDWRRDNGNSEDDWLTLRYGWPDVVGESCNTAGNLGRVLQRRGWTGQLLRCPRCPPPR